MFTYIICWHTCTLVLNALIGVNFLKEMPPQRFEAWNQILLLGTGNPCTNNTLLLLSEMFWPWKYSPRGGGSKRLAILHKKGKLAHRQHSHGLIEVPRVRSLSCPSYCRKLNFGPPCMASRQAFAVGPGSRIPSYAAGRSRGFNGKQSQFVPIAKSK